jgi:hypothetical protein
MADGLAYGSAMMSGSAAAAAGAEVFPAEQATTATSAPISPTIRESSASSDAEKTSTSDPLVVLIDLSSFSLRAVERARLG